MPDLYLSAPRYVLGELPADHADLPSVTDRIAELHLPPRASFWGWGTVHRTARSTAELAVESGLATLRAADLDGGDVDALVLCSTQFPVGAAGDGAFVREVMDKLGLRTAGFVGVGLSQCANLLMGVRVAQAAVAAGLHERVLVVTTDRVDDEATRMEPFALFSDGAASCLVSGGPHGPEAFRLLGSATATRPAELGWGQEISSDLAREVNARLLPPNGLDVGDLDALLHANIFKPIVMLKELQAGFRADQLDPDAIPRTGHCFAADPLINLTGRIAAGRVRTGGHYLLASSVPGLRVGVLLNGPLP